MKIKITYKISLYVVDHIKEFFSDSFWSNSVRLTDKEIAEDIAGIDIVRNYKVKDRAYVYKVTWKKRELIGDMYSWGKALEFAKAHGLSVYKTTV